MFNDRYTLDMSLSGNYKRMWSRFHVYYPTRKQNPILAGDKLAHSSTQGMTLDWEDCLIIPELFHDASSEDRLTMF